MKESNFLITKKNTKINDYRYDTNLVKVNAIKYDGTNENDILDFISKEKNVNSHDLFNIEKLENKLIIQYKQPTGYYSEWGASFRNYVIYINEWITNEPSIVKNNNNDVNNLYIKIVDKKEFQSNSYYTQEGFNELIQSKKKELDELISLIDN